MTLRLPRLALLALALFAGVAAAQEPGAERVAFTDLGPGNSGRLLQQALAQPHRIYGPGADTVHLGASAPHDRTAIALDRNVIVDGVVRGDVFVVGGDLHVHPGARIEGRAVAIGGGVYVSTLAQVNGAVSSFRDHTYRVTRTADGWALAYQPLEKRPGKPFSLPGIYGLRIPTYDRTNGVALPVAPMFAFDSGRIELEPGVTWRTHLGKIDPSLEARVQAGRRTRFEGSARRGTFSNDRWISGDLANSLQALGLGTDTRNRWRADRAEARAFRLVEATATRMEPFVGVRVERGWSVGPYTPPAHVPWSLMGRHSEKGMERPNPPVDSGTIVSALAGSDLQFAAGPVTVDATALVEGGRHGGLSRTFTQGTFDAALHFPTFRNHLFEMATHVVLTAGDTAPRQRFAWIGGTGTIQTIGLLSQGGDQLLFVESRYSIPFEAIQLPLLGPPTVTLRHVLGGAAVHRFPTLTQNLGLRLALGFLRADLVMDPARGTILGGVSLALTR